MLLLDNVELKILVFVMKLMADWLLFVILRSVSNVVLHKALVVVVFVAVVVIFTPIYVLLYKMLVDCCDDEIIGVVVVVVVWF